MLTYFMCKHSVEFFFGHRDSFSVCAVNHNNYKLDNKDKIRLVKISLFFFNFLQTFEKILVKPRNYVERIIPAFISKVSLCKNKHKSTQ